LSERIDLEITGEADIDRYLRKLNLILTKQQLLTGGSAGTANVNRKTNQAKTQINSIAKAIKQVQNTTGVPLDQIPAINRDLRIIMNRLPYGDRVTSLSYRGRQLNRGISNLRATKVLSQAGEDALAKQARIAGITSLTAFSIIAITEVLSQINKIRSQLEQEREEYKSIFMEYKPDLTKEEYEKLRGQSTDQWTKALNYIFRIGV
jgi:septal ring factor EnvC (AmiA/AmiB activator)